LLINVRTFSTFDYAVLEPPMMKIKDLPITPVDPLSPIPLYYQIEADLKQLIRSEKLPAGRCCRRSWTCAAPTAWDATPCAWPSGGW
jgi:hypothetical protein